MSYLVHLNQFEGPLDLLLHLIERAELDIKDIFVSEITTQYLEYMRSVDELDMDTASEFLAMAATLLYIKSRQLLPRPPRVDEELEEDPEVLLIRQLREYKLYKQAGELLLELQQGATGSYTRLPEEYILPEQEIELSQATMDELSLAFLTLLNTQPEERGVNPLHQVQADAFTVRIQIAKIRSRLRNGTAIRFSDLFETGAPKLEMVVTFMALLELVARNEIKLKQKTPFSGIQIHAASLYEEDDDTHYMDEIAE